MSPTAVAQTRAAEASRTRRPLPKLGRQGPTGPTAFAQTRPTKVPRVQRPLPKTRAPKAPRIQQPWPNLGPSRSHESNGFCPNLGGQGLASPTVVGQTWAAMVSHVQKSLPKLDSNAPGIHVKRALPPLTTKMCWVLPLGLFVMCASRVCPQRICLGRNGVSGSTAFLALK